MPKLAYRYDTLTPSPASQSVLIASATARFIGLAIFWVPIADAPAGSIRRLVELGLRAKPKAWFS